MASLAIQNGKCATKPHQRSERLGGERRNEVLSKWDNIGRPGSSQLSSSYLSISCTEEVKSPHILTGELYSLRYMGGILLSLGETLLSSTTYLKKGSLFETQTIQAQNY